ncbi:MAG: pyruvate kinase [Oscillospiraceae bacterium]|nr:pyruvate kinase [Oscillospiraceae bacterium]
MRKTKVICTLGPAVDSVEAISKLLKLGMNGARFNFSHGSHESQLATLEHLRAAMAETGLTAAVILDTKGPEIRVKTFAEGSVELKAGDEFTLRTDEVEGNAQEVSVTYAGLCGDVSLGGKILIDDGLISLKIEAIEENAVRCRVENGGKLSNNKSINIPGANIALPALTEKDKADLRFAAEQGYDYIAASFVRSGADVQVIRDCLDECGGENIRIISKIENQQGVDNLEEIIRLSDGVMVARGDLGVEIPAAKVPHIQKKMIKKCREMGKTVIVATQMLDSMINNPRPTRAEVSDVANAVYDGTCCVMLSGETASGKYPFEALKTMVDIVSEAESGMDYWKKFQRGLAASSNSGISDAVTRTCCLMAADLGAAAILTATRSGYTAKLISRFHPACPVMALSPDPAVCRQLSIVWGVQAFKSREFTSTDEIFIRCGDVALAKGIVKEGDTVVITAGVPVGRTGTTNLIKAEVL